MAEVLSDDSIGKLFRYMLQHMKCMEVRLEYAKCLSSQKQKHTLNQSLNKIRAAMDHLCGLLPDSEAVLKIKADLEQVDLVYVMALTEGLSMLNTQTLEEVSDVVEQFLENKTHTTI